MRVNHLPVNHGLRGLWRALAFVVGAYIFAFGVVGVIVTRGLPVFAQPDQVDLPRSLGITANPAFSGLSIVVGLVVAISCLIGRNVDHVVNSACGVVFLLAGLAMLALLHSDVNIFGFTMVTVIASFVFGLIMFAAGLYGRVGPRTEAAWEEARRHRVVGSNSGVVGDP